MTSSVPWCHGEVPPTASRYRMPCSSNTSQPNCLIWGDMENLGPSFRLAQRCYLRDARSAHSCSPNREELRQDTGMCITQCIFKTNFINPGTHRNETLLPQIRFLTHEGSAFCKRYVQSILVWGTKTEKNENRKIRFNKKKTSVLKSATLEQSNLDL